MTTWLDTEKYAAMILMAALAIFGLGFISWWAVRSTWTKRDITVVAFTILIVIGALTYVIMNPPWPVTPLKGVFR